MFNQIVHICAVSAGMLFMATGANAAIIMSPVNAAASSTYSNTYNGIRYAIDQSGLSVRMKDGKANLAPFLAGDPRHDVLDTRQEWFSANGATTAQLWFDLGAQQDILGVVLWNEESNGFGTATLSASADSAGFTTIGTVTPAISGGGAYPAQMFDLSPITARYVLMDLGGCPQGGTGGGYDGCALGEIAFVVAGELVATPLPAAAPALAGALALMGWAGRRRA